MEAKICSKCGEEKPLADFYLKARGKRTGKDWHAGQCKKCQLAQNFAMNLRKYYGIELEEYQDLFNKQNGLCAICGEVDSRGWRLSTDHDHITGRLRALLCGNCNTAIGSFKDDPELLRKAAEYLESFKE